MVVFRHLDCRLDLLF